MVGVHQADAHRYAWGGVYRFRRWATGGGDLAVWSPRGTICGMLTLCFAALALSQANLPSITAEKLLATRTIGELAFSPDGQQLAMVVGEPLTDEGKISNIWLYNLKAGTLKQLTASLKQDTMPRWAHDGKTLAFRSNRNGGNRIFQIPIDGGEAKAIAESGDTVEDFAWSPDGKQIAYLSTPQSEKKSAPDDPQLLGEQNETTGLYLADLTTKKSRLISPPKQIVTSLDWSNPRAILIDTTSDPTALSFSEKYFQVNPATGTETLVLEPHSFVGNLRLAPTEDGIYYLGTRGESGPTAHDFIFRSFRTSMPENRSIKFDRQYQGFAVTQKGLICAAFQEGFDEKIETRLGGDVKIHDHKGSIETLDVSNGGDVAFVSSRMNEPREVFLLHNGKETKITSFNSAVTNLPLQSLRRMVFKSFDGKPIEAGIVAPERQVGPSKLVAYIHGGPTGAHIDRFDSMVQMLVANGYAVYMPNIRGSTGYGWDFIVSNKLDWGGGDYKDMMMGIDVLVKDRIADPNRLAITGWSYGGYMSAWAVTQTDRFKASVSGAPMTDIASEFGTERPDVNVYDQWFNGSIYDSIKDIVKMSPIVYAKQVKTPTLLLQGDADEIDPIGQSQEFYRALKLNHAPVEMVVYPGAPHGLNKLKHLMDRLKRTVAFFDRYVK